MKAGGEKFVSPAKKQEDGFARLPVRTSGFSQARMSCRFITF